MGLVQKVYERIGELSKPNGSGSWRAYVGDIARMLAESDGSSQHQETYWFAAQAYLATAEIAGKIQSSEEEVKFRAEDKAVPLDFNDIEIAIRGIWAANQLWIKERKRYLFCPTDINGLRAEFGLKAIEG